MRPTCQVLQEKALVHHNAVYLKFSMKLIRRSTSVLSRVSVLALSYQKVQYPSHSTPDVR